MPKIPLEKGYSQMDWLRLTQRDPDLNGLGGKALRSDITMAEVRAHKTTDDAWMVLNGTVRLCAHHPQCPSGLCVISSAQVSLNSCRLVWP